MNTPEKPVAIVSGASRGIGKAIAILLSQNDCVVIGLYKNSENLASSVAEESGIDMIKADVGVEADVQKAMRYVKEKYGRIDVVVNNAGIDIFGRIEEYPVSSWDAMLATNVTAVFLLSKFSIPLLKKSENAVIINISSRLGIGEFTEPDFVVYGAVKAAVNNLTIGLSKELRDDKVRVCAVIPTPTKTDLFDEVFTPEEEQALKDKGKLGSPQDVAEIVLDIINDKSKNGQLILDGRVSL